MAQMPKKDAFDRFFVMANTAKFYGLSYFLQSNKNICED
jgi:hypothetical protein